MLNSRGDARGLDEVRTPGDPWRGWREPAAGHAAILSADERKDHDRPISHGGYDNGLRGLPVVSVKGKAHNSSELFLFETIVGLQKF